MEAINYMWVAYGITFALLGAMLVIVAVLSRKRKRG